jgi:predicted secreted protein with PEFG-CTERM motif
MNYHATYLLAALASIAVLSVSPVFAEVDTPVSIWTDMPIYDHNSMITVQGKVANIRPGADITIRVTNPLNNVVTVDQVKVNSDGTFQTTFNTSGLLWKLNGPYVIKATYGTQEVNNKVIVELTGEISGTVQEIACTKNELSASGQCIPYSISGATVTGARLSTGKTSLIIVIDASNDGGTISLDLPRSVIDAKMGKTDDQFFVLVNGEEADFDETTSSMSRSLSIMFPAGTEEIEIFGTFVVPEFGTVAALILAVAIISIIAVSARSRLNVLPKY